MKRITTAILVVLLAHSLSAQMTVSKDTGLVTFEKIITVDSLAAEKLFDKAKAWAISNFKGQITDARPSVLRTTFTAPHTFNGLVPISYTWSHNLTIKVKNGALKIIFDGFYVIPAGYRAETYFVKSDGTLRQGDGGQKRALVEINQMCEQLTESLQKSLTTNDQW